MSLLVFYILLTEEIFASSNNRIIGGQNAITGQFPHQVSLQYQTSHYCGGSIIAKNWILTSAFCSSQFDNKENLEVLVGTNILNAGGHRYAIKDTIVHSGYDPTTFSNDIALVELSVTILFSSKVSIIQLGTVEPDDYLPCQLSGWGYVKSDTNIILPNLQFTTVRKIPLKMCRLFQLEYNVSDGKNLCTFSKKSGVCVGDSGGPLLYNDVQIGILSWTWSCNKGEPGVYTSVPAFVSWIKRHSGISPNDCNPNSETKIRNPKYVVPLLFCFTLFKNYLF